MNSPSKSAPLAPGELTAEDAERFAAFFKPIWELDDAPFAPAKPGALKQQDMQLAQAGVHAEVQLVSNGIATAVGPHAPPVAYQPAPQAETSVVLEIEPDPTPPPVQHQPVQAQPQPIAQQPVRAQMPTQPPSSRRSSRPPSSKRRPPPQVVRSHSPADVSGDFVPPKKSNAGLYAVIGVVALLAAGGIAYKVVSGSKEDTKTTQPTATQTQTHEEPRIPPPLPVDDTPKVAATDTAKTPEKIDTPTPPPKLDTPPPVRTTTPTTTTPKPPPPVTTTKPVNTGTKPGNKGGGGGIVRDNPF